MFKTLPIEIAIDDLARKIDHTFLKPEATESDIVRICHEAIQYRFKSVCVAPRWVKLAAKLLENSKVLPITVVGFPHGNSLTEIKKAETVASIERGAKEIDMVLWIGGLKSNKDDEVFSDISEIVRVTGSIPVKVILETALLSWEEKKKACQLACNAGATFVKTSTGFAGGGATAEDVRLMRSLCPSTVEVKASGGIRTLEQALAMLSAGASRLGVSASISIIQELNNKTSVVSDKNDSSGGSKDGY